MKIIKQGVIPKEEVQEEKNYQSTCSNCGTVFQFKKDECNLSISRISFRPIVHIECPLCEMTATYFSDLDEFEVKE